MATNVGAVNIVVNYVLNQNSTRQINNSINQLQNRAPRLQTAFTSAFAKIGAAAAAAFSVKAIVDFTKEATNLASELEEVQNVVNVVFGDMTAEIDRFAKNAIRNFGLGEAAAKQYAGTYAAMAQSFGFTNEEVMMLSKSLTQMVGDTASFRNVSHSIANTKLKAVFTGETEALKEWGIVMTQAALQEYAYSRGIDKTIQKMTEKEKVILRYNFVMSQLENDMGDFQRTQDGWANQIRILSDKISTVIGTFGQGFIVILTPAIQALNQFIDVLQIAANKFASFVGLLFGKKASVSEEKAQAQIAAIGATASSSTEELSDLADGYTAAGKAAAKATDSLASFDNVIQLADGSSASGGSGANGAAGGSSFGLDQYNFEEMGLEQNGTLIDKLSEKIKNLSDSFGLFDFEKIKGNFKRIGDSLSEIIHNIAPSSTTFSNSFIEALKTVGIQVLRVGQSVIESITGGMALWLEQGKIRISEQWSAILNNFALSFDNLKLLTEDLGFLLSDFFSLEDTQQIFANVMSGFEGVVTGSYLIISDLFSAITNLITNVIDKNIYSFNDLFSTTSTFYKSVTDLIKTVVLDCFSTVHKLFEQYIRPVFNNIEAGFTHVVGAIVNIWNSAVVPLLTIIADSFKDLWSNHLKVFVENVLSVGAQFLELVSFIWGKVLAPIISFVYERFIPPLTQAISVIWGLIEGLAKNIIDIASGVVQVVKGVLEVINGIFTLDFKRVCNGLLDILGGLAKSIFNVFTWTINAVIGAFNGLIKAANKIKVPGTDVGLNLSEIPRVKLENIISIPKLAEGGIVNKQTNFGSFIAGEAGAEAIVPLENSSYTKILAREIVAGMLDAGFGGDTYNISTAYLDKRGLEKLTHEINGVNRQIGARKGVIAYG